MNLGNKNGLDAMLADWPAPLLGEGPASEPEESLWDARADAIVKAALEAKVGDLDAVLAAPGLLPEAGESGVALLSGERMMTQEKGGEGDAASVPPAPRSETPLPPAAGERKRTSLKEIAARASQSGGRPSSPGAPPPSVAPPRPSTGTPLPRPVEAGKEDSGVINLDVVRASVTAQQIAAAEKAKPAQAGLFDEDPAQARAAAAPPKVAVVAAKKSNTGPIAGVAIAVLGIAAAFAIVARKPVAPPPIAAGDAARPAITAGATAAPVKAPTPAAHETAAPTAVASTEPSPPATADADNVKPAEPSHAVAAGTAPPGTAAAKEAPADAKLAAKGAGAAPEKPGDLQSEMARAVGPTRDGDKSSAALPAPEPAAGGARNQNIPEQPSQGSVQAAVGAVIGGAKACVAGADDVSRAQLTFSSTGTVTSVSVSGWAAAHGKSACVQGALRGAKVGPFSKPSFTVGVTIHP